MKSGRLLALCPGPALMALMLYWRQLMKPWLRNSKSHLAHSRSSEKGILDICQGQPLTLSQLGQLDTS
ncbi:anhydro-N-acetylmuramic acid kinase [Salmonella enterica subsp. enterica]|uniref:Anhydro-N-acetylmuramic acid kinase n=1 Tax=Salmonella enterica I TaxID=59201 RepID=A0A379W913_SALET|nr:anhydro-N-acetylmuramic acid kinase [Salmonella enterica subsp. enterica]